MGYSEIYCHICGVSFNISRLRRADTTTTTITNTAVDLDTASADANKRISNVTTPEGRAAAWRQGTEDRELGQTFVSAARNSWTGECRRDAGCGLIFRGFWMRGEEVVEEQDDNDGGDDGDGDYVLTSDEGGEMTDEAYEFETPEESCCSGNDDDEGEDVDVEMDDYSAEDDEDQDGRRPDGPSHKRYSEFVRMVREGGKIAVPDPRHEIVLPLFRPLEDGRTREDDEHGSEASFECDDAEKDSHAYNAAKLDHWLVGKLSCWKHPLSSSKSGHHHHRGFCENEWEHIAGPRCENVMGYSGHRITVEEMQGCGTLQCLVRKFERQESGVDDKDADWEVDSDWYLSGLSDYMPSRDIDCPRVFPPRYGEDRPWAENCMWQEDEREQYAMPFHPGCLEVWKRASLKLTDKMDVEVLANWWTLNATYDKFHGFPRDPAVKRGEAQEWNHNVGDEFLAANPCFIPGYEKVLEDVRTSCQTWANQETQTAPPTKTTDIIQSGKSQQHHSLQQPRTMNKSLDIFSVLHTEIWYQIFTHLSTVEVAYLQRASRSFHKLPQSYIRHHLLRERPYLWELWCQQPYSRWTGTTATALEAFQKQCDVENEEIELVLEVLSEDGYIEARDTYKQYWDENRLERRPLEAKSVIMVEEDEIDYARLAIELEERLEKGQLKGLRNRARIWKDCETILSEIEELKKDGKITAEGKIAGKWVFDDA